jgi:acyl-CoA thioester hydrolase
VAERAARSGRALAHQVRVRYGECDPQGIVFNAHYLTYFDLSITELWRASLGSYQAMTDRGVDIVVAQARVRFHLPARFDELLNLHVGVTRLGTTSLSTAHRVTRDRDLLAEGELHHVFVELPGLRKISIPDWIRRPLEAYVIH